MPEGTPQRRMDLSQKDVFKLQRQRLEREGAQTEDELEPTHHTPFSWPEAYIETLHPLQEQTTTTEGTPLNTQWHPLKNTHGERVQLTEHVAHPLVVEEIGNTEWKQIGETSISYFRDPEGSPFSTISSAPDGTIVATRKDGSILLRQPHGPTRNLASPNGEPFFNASMGADGSIIARAIEERIYIQRPDGTASFIDHPPEYAGLYEASIQPDGTILAVLSGGICISYHPDGTVMALEDPEQLLISHPKQNEHGTLVAEGDNLILLRQPNGSTSILQINSEERRSQHALSNPTISTNGSIVMGQNGHLIIREPDNTTSRITHPNGGKLFRPHVDATDTLYAIDEDGRIIRAPARSQYPAQHSTANPQTPRRSF